MLEICCLTMPCILHTLFHSQKRKKMKKEEETRADNYEEGLSEKVLRSCLGSLA